MPHPAEVLPPQILQRGGIYLESNHGPILFDRFARRSLSLPTELVDEQQVKSVVEASLTFLNEPDPTPEAGLNAVRIQAMVEDIYRSQPLRQGLPVLLNGMQSVAQIDLELYFSTPPTDWKPLLRWIGSLSPEGENLLFRVSLTGPFPVLEDSLKEWMMALEIHPRYSLGVTCDLKPKPIWLPFAISRCSGLKSSTASSRLNFGVVRTAVFVEALRKPGGFHEQEVYRSSYTRGTGGL